MFEASEVYNPFPGLRPFEIEETNLFFGRDGQSDELLARLCRNRLLAVVGTSGSGKSSLIRAGLLPALYGGLMGGGAGSNWRIAILRPGHDPIGNLAYSLGQEDVLGSGGQDPEIQNTLIETTLRRSSLGLVDAVRQARMSSHENVLVVVDQFEELFRFKEARQEASSEDAATFVKLLIEASPQIEIPIYVVLTMRSDFLGECSQFAGLPEAINQGQYLIPRMSRDERRAAITGPVAVGGGDITLPLVTRLLNDVGDNPDQLPILQHALMRTWDFCVAHRRNGQTLGLDHYEAIGTMSEALSRHADEAFDELRDERSRAVAEKLFKLLTERGADNREIRRPTRLAEICAVAEANEDEVIAVIEVFRREGRSFLMPPAGVALNSETVIDISHESLIRNWKRLQAWVDDEAQSARVYRRLAEAAVLHREGSEGLLQDPGLQIALDWYDKSKPNAAWAARYHPEFDQSVAYLEQSSRARAEALAERERQRNADLERAKREREQAERYAAGQARAAHRLRWLMVGMAVMFILALATAAFAIKSRADAKTSEGRAITARDEVALALKSAKEAKNEADRLRAIADESAGRAKKANEGLETAKKGLEVALAAAERAKDDAREQQAKAERLKNEAVAAIEANNLYRNAWTLVKQDNHAKAMQKFKEATVKFGAIRDFSGVGASYFDLGDLQLGLASGKTNEKEGLKNFDKAIEAFRLANDRDGEAAVLVNKGEYFLSHQSVDLTGPDPVVDAEGRGVEGFGMLKQALTLYEATGNDEAQIKVLATLGEEFFRADDVAKKKEGLRYISGILPLYRKRQEWDKLRDVMLVLASHYADLKDEAENEKYLAEAIKIYEDTNDPLGKVKILARIISRFRSDTPQYAKYLEKILRATEEVRKPADKAAALKEVASVYIGGAEFRKGLDYYEKAIKAYADAGLRKEQAGLLVEAGVQSGGYSRSTQDKRLTPGFYQRALTIYRELGDRESEDDVLSRLGSHYDTNDQLPEAIDSFKQQAALPGIGPKREADLHSKIAWLQKRLERWEESIVSNRRALVIYESMANRSSQSDTLVSIGEGHVRLNQLGQSLEAFKQAGALQPGRNYKALQANHIFNRGEAEEKKQQLSKALESYKQALVLFKEIDKYEERVKDAETKIEKVSKSLQPPQP